MALAVITFGANLPHDGNPPEITLKTALNALSALDAIDVAASSRWYRSPAVPVESRAPDYINGCVLVRSLMSPNDLLASLHAIEDRFGRRREARWAPRPVDLDLIAVDDLVLPDAETEARWRTLGTGEAKTLWPDTLILPHPRMAERAFVLKPMADVWPYWRHPATGLTVTDMLDALDAEDRDAVREIA